MHTDAQTVVDDARITIIGRSRIHASDTPGVEIANLVASDFINRFDEGDVLYRTIATDAARVFVAGTNPTLDTGSSGLAFVAVGLALSDANAITSPTSASPGDQTTMQNDMAALQVAINQALTDLATLSSDASAFSTASGGSSAHPTANVTDSTSAIASAWKANVASAVAAMTNLQWAADAANNLLTAAVSAPPPLNLSAFVGAINAMSNAATGWRGTVNTAVTMVPTLPMSAPDCPNPSVTASYINLPHLDVNGNNQMGPSDGQPIDTSTANPVTLSVQDTTALDMLDPSAFPSSSYLLQGYTLPNPVPPPAAFRAPGTPWPLNSGSDVKLVGGDNVTLAANDARSHTQGHSYGLVQGGQTSVVYSPDKYQGAVSSANGNHAAPNIPTRPSPVIPQSWSASSLAQVSTVYGNARSWTDGDTDATVTGSATTTIENWRNTFIKGSTQTELGSNVIDSHNTKVMGSRALELFGTDCVPDRRYEGLA